MRRRRGAALFGVVASLSGCTYYNTLYNAELLYQEGERHRVEGRDSLAELRFREVVAKTAEAYRGRPTWERADEVLFQLGRAQLRVGDAWAARLALEEARRTADDPQLRAEIQVYLGSALARTGDVPAALTTLYDAVGRGVSGPALAEARLLLGSLVLSGGPSEVAWSDLDRAGVADPVVRLDAGVERLRLSLEMRDRARAQDAVTRVLQDPDAQARLDTIVALVRAAARAWGPTAGAHLLAGVDSSTWRQPARGLVRLERARLLREAGDSVAAREEGARVAAGRGEAAAQARLFLAGWRLELSQDLAGAASARAILLPESGHPRVAEVLSALDEMARYADMGLDEPLAWFVAAEIARDRLASPRLARGLLLAYAGANPAAPWTPKALLAALEVASTEEDRVWLRGRLEEHRRSPYVLAAFGQPNDGFEALEQELRVRLGEIKGR